MSPSRPPITVVRLSLFLAVLLTVAASTSCSSLSTAKSCSTLHACSTLGAGQFGSAVLTPRGATFVKGSLDNAVLELDLRDAGGLAYKELVGRPSSTKAGCPGTVVTLSPTRRFCYGTTTSGLLAQFTAGKLLYTLSFPLRPATAAVEKARVLRIVSSLG